MAEVVVVPPRQRIAGPSTPGMVREQAVADVGVWAGYVTTEPGMVSGWHHHGPYRTVFYVLGGAFRLEFGHAGSVTVEAGPGDFAFVPAGLVHRESNPTQEEAVAIVVRAGEGGEAVVNVDGPEG